MTKSTYNVCLMNSADPRGTKIGGIETYLRDYIYYHPEDMRILFIGADEIGDLEIGKITEVEFRGRKFDFLPLYFLDNSVNQYPTKITESETYRFASTLLKSWSKIRKILKDGGFTAEIRRVEYAPVIWSMGIPFIQMVHVWGDKSKPMSGLMGKYWYIRTFTEYIAAALCEKYYSVNSDMTAMYKKQFRRFSHKFDTLTTWANTTIFKPSPYVLDGTLKVFFAGRMDKFKRPDIMFQVIKEVARLNSDPVEFHYVGDGDPAELPEFADIANITVRHGRKNSIEIAAILKEMHVGILTSEFEGMPRVVMEVLTTGRPVVALHLPQLESVLKNGVSGFLIERTPDHVTHQAERIVEAYELMKSGRITPETVAMAVADFTPQALLGKIQRDHRRLHGLPA